MESAVNENLRTSQTQPRSARSKAPVFVLGCGRSGTKLLYYSLLSAGGFAVFPEESAVFAVLGRHFGNLAHRGNRRKLLDAYLNSGLFRVTGIDPKEFEDRVMEDCRNPGDLLRFQMEAIARKQGVERWAESTPKHILYLPLIKKVIPDALVIHMIRDGRDSTASMHRAGRIHPLPWDKSRDYLARAMYWRWMVGKGRRYGKALGGDYLELHYEELVGNPREALARVGKFIDQDLDYDHIQKVGLGTVRTPNSSFKNDSKENSGNSVGRWKRVFTPEQAQDIEWTLGKTLIDTGYTLDRPLSELRPSSLAVRFMDISYPMFLETRQWFKANTPISRLADRDSMGVVDCMTNE
jgi:hypothetical protein